MSALAVFLDLRIYSMIFFFLLLAHRPQAKKLTTPNRHVDMNTKSLGLLVKAGTDIVKSTYILIDSLEPIKQKNMFTPSYEIGYLMFNTFEIYRRMINKWNTSHFMNTQLYIMEHVLYLEEIENHYWELDHMTSMLHEIERKYNVSTPINSKYHEITSGELHIIKAKQLAEKNKYTGRFQTLKKIVIKQKLKDKLKGTTRGYRPTRFPLEYGWDYPHPDDLTTKAEKSKL